MAGATGAVGEQLVMQLLEQDQEVTVHLLSRRATRWHQHPQVIEHILPLSRIADLQIAEPVNALFCCLGSTIKQAGSASAFKAVDLEAVLALGQWASSNGCQQFHVISSIGVSDRARGLYLKTKWQMESGLEALGLNNLVIYQPSLLVVKRYPRRLAESVAAQFSKLLSWLPGARAWRPIPVSLVATTMLRIARQIAAQPNQAAVQTRRLGSKQMWQ